MSRNIFTRQDGSDWMLSGGEVGHRRPHPLTFTPHPSISLSHRRQRDKDRQNGVYIEDFYFDRVQGRELTLK